MRRPPNAPTFADSLGGRLDHVLRCSCNKNLPGVSSAAGTRGSLGGICGLVLGSGCPGFARGHASPGHLLPG
jgi:hypothetical protein